MMSPQNVGLASEALGLLKLLEASGYDSTLPDTDGFTHSARLQ